MVSRYSVPRELALGVLARVPIEGMTLERPIHILHRKGKHLSPVARRFLAFAAEYIAEGRHLTPPVLLLPGAPETAQTETVKRIRK
jgi:DNA-binding transcriptional LysR family regulator